MTMVGFPVSRNADAVLCDAVRRNAVMRASNRAPLAPP